MSNAGQLKRSFKKTAKFKITVIGNGQRTGKIQATAKTQNVRLGSMKGYWFNPERETTHKEGGEQYSHTAIFQFLSEEINNFEVAEKYKIVRGDVETWDKKDIWEIASVERVNEVKDFFLLQLMLRKNRD